MHVFINSPLEIGSLTIPHRLIQGPLAGYSCAPFRTLFNFYAAPAYCVSEMISARDVLNKHASDSRYIYRDPREACLAYQIAGVEPEVMAQAAYQLQQQGANLIDINCGCPKPKIRKKGAGSALLESPARLLAIIHAVRAAITIPLTIKIRIQGNEHDYLLAQQIAEAGADALIVHGRRWLDDYQVKADLQQIGHIKQHIHIPVIANGDIADVSSLAQAMLLSGCDAFMISRAASGRPWLYESLLKDQIMNVSLSQKIVLFMTHLRGLAALENEYKAALQSKSLIRYYFGKHCSSTLLKQFHQLYSLAAIEEFLMQNGQHL